MLKLLYPSVSKFCIKCYELNDNSIYLTGTSNPCAWWSICKKCGDRFGDVRMIR